MSCALIDVHCVNRYAVIDHKSPNAVVLPVIKQSLRCCLRAGWLLLILCLAAPRVRGEAMLELFQTNWKQITQKMPELAEAGYDSLWLPNPAKGNSGSYSIGYDLFDPFDLGSTNQQGTIATKYGTQADLIQMVQTAHRFGIRIYFDNVMNHRSGTVPGYPNSGIATNYYPGLIPQDFHLQVVSGGYQNWPNVSNWCWTQDVQNDPLLGLCDLANEPGTVNWNFGTTWGNTTTKPNFVRFPNRPDLYMNTNGPLLGTGWGGAGWRPFDGHGQPVAEDVSLYLCRAVAWTLYMTKCDGFRLDAVKHVPANFFGNATGTTDDAAFAGYNGAIQAMYDYVHGYGANVTSNGYVESDGNRNSLFNTEAPRNDAMVFGEYIPQALPQGADYFDYINSGMRLLNQPLYNYVNGIFNYGNSTAGMDGRDYAPSCVNCNCDGNGNYSMAQAVNMPQTQDGGTCCPANPGMEDAYMFMHEGLPGVYSDGFNHNTGGGTPIVSYANYLGEFGDNSMPEIMSLHNQLARGGTWARWSDQNVAAFERYDYREGNGAQPQTQDVALFAWNTRTSYPGDMTFDDGVSRTSDEYYGNIAVSNSKGQGLAVGFAPGSVLVQVAGTSPTGGRAYSKLLVHGATQSLSTAQSTANATDPTQRLIYVGTQTIPSGGGAIELNLPSDAWVIYAYQWPEASRANISTNAIVFRQAGTEVPHVTIYRTDGVNGDTTNYNPIFPFKMRGSVDVNGNVIGGTHVSNLTYSIDVPIVTNAAFDILVRSDASCSNTMVKLDGGIDLNSQMGLGPLTFNGTAPTNFLDLRDNKPGYTNDMYLGYEQTAFQFRNGPEKFAARNIASNTVVSAGAETYYYTVGGTSNVVSGSGFGAGISNSTASWVFHDPVATNSASAPNNSTTQRVPLSPTSGQSVDLYVKVGYQFQINTCYIYYTVDGTNPEGAFGVGKGTTQVVQAFWANHDSAQSNIDWWKGTIPAQPNGTQVRYKIALFNGGSVYAGQSINPISDAEATGAKYYGINQAAITNFNPTSAIVWLHNDLNPANTITGLQSGFHIIRAKTMLPRAGQSSVFNTFVQTFYYDGALPGGAIAFPASDGSMISNQTYSIVIRADSTATAALVNIWNSATNNWDIYTGQNNGIGNDLSGNPIFVPASSVTPNSTLNAVWTNYPQEFRFNYANVPSTGTAVITVKLNEYTTSIYTNRYTTLTRSINVAAPTQVVQISNPQADGQVLTINSGNSYPIQVCFSTNLTSSINNFSIFINGVFQLRRDPSSQLPYYFIGGSACGTSMRTLTYNWPNAIVGTNVIQVIYTNSITLNDTRTVIVAPPLKITGLTGNNQYLMWDSAPGLYYQVLATTNLLVPFAPIGVVPGQGTSTVFFDDSPTFEKYFEIQALTNSP